MAYHSPMGPMEGIKVVELGFWIAAPACAAILSDWGAEVIKVEPLTGDPYRGFRSYFEVAIGRAENPPFESDNRGKRDIALDYTTPEGKEILLDLIAQADVFVTNVRRDALLRNGLDHETISKRFPRLIYGCLTALGLEGPEVNRPGFDVGMFWARSGVAAALALPGEYVASQRGGMGDHMTGIAAAAGISAALFQRERTGRGQVITTALIRLGSYMMSFDLACAIKFGLETVAADRRAPANPLTNYYMAQDGRQFVLLGVEPDRLWPVMLRAFGKPEWADDPRFIDSYKRAENTSVLVAELDAIFATRPRSEWMERFDAEGVWYAPVNRVDELITDLQAQLAGCFVPVPQQDGSTMEMPATPVTFLDYTIQPTLPSPEVGQHSEEILLDLGYDWDRITALKDRRVIN